MRKELPDGLVLVGYSFLREPNSQAAPQAEIDFLRYRNVPV